MIGELSAALRYFDNFEQIVTAFKQASETLYEEGFAEDLGKYFGYNVDGSSGNDSIYGTDAEENMNGRGGNDKIYAGGGNDAVLGGEGDDYLYGEDGNDVLQGESGNDYLIGGDGDDILTGGTATIIWPEATAPTSIFSTRASAMIRLTTLMPTRTERRRTLFVSAKRF